jgi:hypothetical protein
VTCVLSHEGRALRGNDASSPCRRHRQQERHSGDRFNPHLFATLLARAGPRTRCGEDDDGKSAVAGEKISDEQAGKLLNLIDTKVVGTEGRLLKWARVERIEDLPAARYAEAVEKLKSVQAAS